MRIKLTKENLAKTLNICVKAVASNPNIPVLNNVLINARGSSVTLATTNLEIGITANIGGEILEEGAVTVSAKLITEFVNSLKAGTIELELKENKFVVKSVDNYAEFVVIPADEFPEVPVSEGNPLVELNTLDFVNIVDKTTFAASNDNSRPILTGILTKITPHKLEMVGVDGFRLSQCFYDVENGPEHDFKEIIPARSLNELSRIIKTLSEDDGNVGIFFVRAKNQIVFRVGDVELATRLIEGEFPAYEDILPKSKQLKFVMDKKALADSVKVASIFAKNVAGNKTRFKVDAANSKLTLGVDVADMGNNETNVELFELTGEDVETAYNAKFMQDMINACNSEQIVYETKGAVSPGVFLDTTDENYLHLIMPMRLV